MTVTDFFNFFLLISALHGFLFCLLLLFSKNGKKKSLVYINLLVLTISLNNIQSWILAKNFFIEYFLLDYIQTPWHFLIAPFFYMFLIHYLKIETQSRNILKLIIPVFLVLIFIKLAFFNFFSDKQADNFLYIFEKYTLIEEIISLVVSLSVFGYSYYILTKKEDLFDKILTYDNLKWVYTFFKLGAFTYIFWISAVSITVYLNFQEFIYSYYPLRVLTTVLVYWIGYQSVFQLKVLNERKYIRNQIQTKPSKEYPNAITTDVKSLKASDDNLNIPATIIESVLAELELFETEKRYLYKNITLGSLAAKLNTNANYLSKIINHYQNTSFSNYLNNLRINNIVHQLEINPMIREFTIKAIAHEAGFNNSDSFSKVFYKVKGVKPSQYIRELTQKDNTP